MTEREEFDRIVQGLDLDLSFPDEVPDPVPEPDPTNLDATDGPAATQEEPFYRRVDSTPLIPRRRGIVLAWSAVLGIPLLLGLARLADIFVARSLTAGAALIVVASAIYLFLQLPEHGPSRRDWPDDGAVL